MPDPILCLTKSRIFIRINKMHFKRETHVSFLLGSFDKWQRNMMEAR